MATPPEPLGKDAVPDGLTDEEWEREQGIPQFSDPFIQKYFSGRDALIVQEGKSDSNRP